MSHVDLYWQGFVCVLNQKFHIELLQAAARPIECNQSIRDAQLLRNNISLGEKSCDSGPPINLLSRGLVGCDK
jgi:hypothetical protein